MRDTRPDVLYFVAFTIWEVGRKRLPGKEAALTAHPFPRPHVSPPWGSAASEHPPVLPLSSQLHVAFPPISLSTSHPGAIQQASLCHKCEPAALETGHIQQDLPEQVWVYMGNCHCLLCPSSQPTHPPVPNGWTQWVRYEYHDFLCVPQEASGQPQTDTDPAEWSPNLLWILNILEAKLKSWPAVGVGQRPCQEEPLCEVL